MGEVYLAKDTLLDRSVALKILPPEVADNEERLSRFVREAKAASALSHANVAHIYEMGEAEGVHFIAMEYVEGQTLATILEGMYEVAIEHYERLAELREGWLAQLGYVYAVSGRREDALDVLQRLHDLSMRRYVPPIAMEMVHAGLDEKTVAFEWSDKAGVDRDSQLVFVRAMPFSDALKTDPRYTDLLRRIGLEP